MPKIDGYELYDRIKKADDKVKVCYISAAFMDYEKAKEVCVIQKPFEIPDLIAKVKAELL